jgi:hypothetical protein
MAQRPVTLKDIVAGHVSLDIEAFDRIYLNGWVPALQTSGQVAGWLGWRGFPIASPAALGKISQGFRAAVRRYADSNDIPWVVFRKGDRKLDVMRPRLDAAEKAGASKVVAIGEAREFQWVFDATRKDGPDGVPWFRFYRTERLVTCYYFYLHDRRIGPAFIKVCAYAPYPVKVWCNGHEIARRAALAEGIAVTPLANGFAATSDPARLQELCDMVQAGTLRVFFESWMSRIPLPLAAADREHDCWWQLSMRQVEVSRTLVFDDPRRVRTVFEQLLAGNMNLGRPEHAEIIFASKVTRKTPGTFSTRLLNRADQVTVNLSFKHSRIKIYLKEDRALRIETVVNDAGDLGCKRGLEHLDELSGKARACNARLMDAVVAGQGSGILANPVIERIAHPSCDAAGRRIPAMRFGDPRVQALAGCLAVWEFAVSGITNQRLRAWMTGLRGGPYSMNQASYDLARLRRNGLIERIARTNTCRLTPDGLTFALVYSRVHDQVLYPLTAHDQPIAAPAPVRAAWRAITRHIDSTVAAAHLGRAA